MAPNRAETVISYAFASLTSLIQPGTFSPAGFTATGLLGVLGWAFGYGNMGILAVAGAAMLLDLIVGSFKAALDKNSDFCVRRLYGGFLGKLFRTLIIPTASLIDWLFIVSPVPLSDSAEALFPATMLAAIGLAAAELSSTIRKFRGSGVDPGLLEMLLRRLQPVRGDDVS